MDAAKGIQIHQAGIADTQLIAEMGMRTFEVAFGPKNNPDDMRSYLGKAFSNEQICLELEDTASTFLLAYRNILPIAYCKLMAGEGPSFVQGVKQVELQRIYVEADAMGHGIGSRLLQVCFREAARAGHDMIWLGVWEKNRAAIRFYENWGFQQVGSQPFLLGKDLQTDWVMQRHISSKDKNLPKGNSNEI